MSQFSISKDLFFVTEFIVFKDKSLVEYFNGQNQTRIIFDIIEPVLLD